MVMSSKDLLKPSYAISSCVLLSPRTFATMSCSRKALGAMIVSEHTSCICAIVHVAFYFNAVVVHW